MRVNKNPRCTIVVKALVSSFEIAAEREELLVANRHDHRLGFHIFLLAPS